MPSKHMISFSCQNCGESFPIRQYITINPADPMLRTRVLSGDLFRQTCPHCGKKQLVIYNCLYRDGKKKFAVALQANGRQPSTLLLPGYAMRVEYSLLNFVERVRILDAGLNDLAFELFRMAILLRLQKEHPNHTITMLRFDAMDNDNIYLQTGDTEQIQVSKSSYLSMKEKLDNSGFVQKVGGYLNVNADWVQSSGVLDAIK